MHQRGSVKSFERTGQVIKYHQSDDEENHVSTDKSKDTSEFNIAQVIKSTSPIDDKPQDIPIPLYPRRKRGFQCRDISCRSTDCNPSIRTYDMEKHSDHSKANTLPSKTIPLDNDKVPANSEQEIFITNRKLPGQHTTTCGSNEPSDDLKPMGMNEHPISLNASK